MASSATLKPSRSSPEIVDGLAPKGASASKSSGPPAANKDDAFRRAGIDLDARAARRNRILNAFSITIPIVGAAAAVAFIPTYPPTLTTVAVFVVFFLINGLGITLGLHRYFTHQAFETRPAFAAVLAVAGSWAFQGSIKRWVADHRRHHRFTDRQFDPHSPHCDENGAKLPRWRGMLHAHLLWMVAGLRSCEKRYASDITNNAVANWCSNHYWLVAATGILLPWFGGYIIGGPREAIACALWAGFVRVALLHQITWCVNSLGHTVGEREDGATDEARNNPLLAILILGEGLHGFHHRYPNAAIKRPLRFDLTGALIILLEKTGIVWNVKRASVAARRAA